MSLIKTMSTSIKNSIIRLFTVSTLVLLAIGTALAQGGFSGAIYDTDSTSLPVNQNIYAAKEDVYLNGGPQNPNANGLPFETFYFQVTDPSGKHLLSTDPAVCRQVIVGPGPDGKGVIMGTAPGRPVFCTDGTLFPVDTVPGGFPGTHQPTNPAPNPTNGSIGVQLMPYNTTPNQGGEYKIWLIRQTDTTSIDADGVHIIFNNNDAKTDNFKIREGEPPTPDQTFTLSGCKFYDANGNGIWDDTEVTIPGFQIIVVLNGEADDPIFTGADGCWSREKVPAGAEYVVYEVIPDGNWIQSYPEEVLVDIGNGPEMIRAHNGFADDPDCTDLVCLIEDLDFGNYCELIPGGQTLGFWSNKNGLEQIDAAEAAQLNAFNLRNANGSDADFTFPGDFSGKKPAFSTWLLSASASNMANMLSAQLAATYLSVANGYTDTTVIVGNDGDGNPMDVNDLIVYANSLLANPIAGGPYGGQNGSVTVVASALRDEQNRIKNILDHINNDGGFIQPEPCEVVYDGIASCGGCGK